MSLVRTILLAAIVLLAAGAVAPSSAMAQNVAASGDTGGAASVLLELAASPKEMQCLKACMETHGADKKKACALECGLAKGHGPRGKKPDCGIQYKACNKACAKDKACKKRCRAQRRACI